MGAALDATAGRRTIGVFDSGVGGLSVAAEIRRQLPGEAVVYLADQAYAPYGDRALDAVRGRVFAVVDHLLGLGAGPIVVACNTASAAALRDLRAAHPEVLFVGMEPAVKPAASQSASGVVGVLATRATFQGELYASVVHRHAAGVEVVAASGTGLVELVEAGTRDGPAVESILRSHLEPLLDAGIDTLVLGCTHYSFLTAVIRRLVGDEVRLIDPSPAVARQLLRVLGDPVVAAGETSTTTYLTTGDVGWFRFQVNDLMGDVSDPAGIVI